MVATFCGHKEVTNREAVGVWLRDTCEKLIAEGVKTFYLGGYGGFDELAASTLRDIKRRHSEIQIILILPYLNNNINADGYDATIYPPLESVPLRYAIARRNQWMVEQSSVIIAYVVHSWGGAAKTLAYAQRRQKPIIQYAK